VPERKITFEKVLVLLVSLAPTIFTDHLKNSTLNVFMMVIDNPKN
jgi:hypothetical protein